MAELDPNGRNCKRLDLQSERELMLEAVVLPAKGERREPRAS